MGPTSGDQTIASSSLATARLIGGRAVEVSRGRWLADSDTDDGDSDEEMT
ncbi:MAG: hypothetical protein LC808_42805 [Actinobacteria bacterium]|nr:hypothetical protein [Actinomycetota bacterium]